MAQKPVKIYSKSNCAFCERAKKLFKDKGISYEDVNLDDKEAEYATLQAKTGMKTVPQIFIGEKLVGGYRELTAFEATGELDRMLNQT